jgi:hypothetical protein
MENEPKKEANLSEEEIISKAVEQAEKDLESGKTPMIFIPDTTGEGPGSESAAGKTLELANKVVSALEEKGLKVSIERDPADFREFYLNLEK